MKLLLLTLGCCIYSLSFAQVNANAELKSLINQSFTNFSKVKEVENTVKTAEEKLKLNSLNKTPDVNFNIGYNFIMPKISFNINGREIQFAPTNNIGTAVSSNYTLVDFGRLKTLIEKSKSELLVSKDNVEIIKSNLANQIAAIYYNIVYFQKAIAIQDSIISYFKENKQWVENRLKSGDMIKIDVLNLEANIDAEQNKKIDLVNSLNKQFNLLEYTTGSKTANGKSFDFDIDDSKIALSIAEQNNPEFKMVNDKIIVSKKEIDLIKLNNKPKINLSAATGLKNGYVPDVNEIKFNYLAGLSFVVPLYGFGKNKQQIKLQETLVSQNELAQKVIADNYKKDIAQTLLDINSNKERLQNTKSQIAATKMAEQITASRYQNGVATYLDVIAAASNVQKASLSQLQYEYQLCIAKIEMSRLLGFYFWNN